MNVKVTAESLEVDVTERDDPETSRLLIRRQQAHRIRGPADSGQSSVPTAVDADLHFQSLGDDEINSFFSDGVRVEQHQASLLSRPRVFHLCRRNIHGGSNRRILRGVLFVAVGRVQEKIIESELSGSQLQTKT